MEVADHNGSINAVTVLVIVSCDYSSNDSDNYIEIENIGNLRYSPYTVASTSK